MEMTLRWYGSCLLYTSCHGNTGLWMMLDYLGQTQYNRNILSVGALSLEDRLSPGFMTGLSGIGYALMREENRELPDVIGFW